MCFKESFFQKLWDNRFRQGHLWQSSIQDQYLLFMYLCIYLLFSFSFLGVGVGRVRRQACHRVGTVCRKETHFLLFSTNLIQRSKVFQNPCFQGEPWVSALRSEQKQPPAVFCKKSCSEILQSSQENSYARFSFLIKVQACIFIKKETLAQVFSC